MIRSFPDYELPFPGQPDHLTSNPFLEHRSSRKWGFVSRWSAPLFPPVSCRVIPDGRMVNGRHWLGGRRSRHLRLRSIVFRLFSASCVLWTRVRNCLFSVMHRKIVINP
ncbi:hypothetical protein TNIN_14921 [Trichonephila inaurata madagascariensis]|uniref:Uncharacterized protein n=1 Tax=Trichonephila inaurata madagascariensis TaxID=2747483 RepID=A0A8X7BP26_9ARAC|nr:hypothetical protein TNIN_14921 [Trichonephila inaurata madagascariensis]